MTTEATTDTDTETVVGKIPYMDVLRSLDGYEEEAIEAAFGRDIDSLAFGRQLRALAFVLRRRRDVDAVTAKREVMTMTVHLVFQEFSDLRDPDAEVLADASEAVEDPS